ncbi:MAG: cysteine desulfurase [Candidatus Magasanikbacteria bacterium]|nr:cysteine desulfurase [Candidatus Magasanikbacteria bacterium]
MNTMRDIREQFDIFKQHPDLAYLDNASSTQTPHGVLGSMDDYYTKYRANIHRGLYKLSDEATQAYEGSRVAIAKYLNVEPEEIVFTSGATQGLNLLAYGLCKTLGRGDVVVLTQMEHHANLIPWQEMAHRYGFALRFIPLNPKTYLLDMEQARLLFDKQVKIVSCTMVSNTLGTINPVSEILELARSVGALSLVDAAQAAGHIPIDARSLDCDFAVFSGHKMYGPTGIGILYGKKEMLSALDPFIFGGDMIREVTYERATWAEAPAKFEAGTPHIAGAIGLKFAVDFIHNIGWNKIQTHEKELTAYALSLLAKVDGLNIIGPASGEQRIGVISFTIDGLHSHDIADILDKYNVAVRAGYHCNLPLMKLLGLNGTVRISIGIYNTKEDINRLVEGIKDAVRRFSK